MVRGRRGSIGALGGGIRRASASDDRTLAAARPAAALLCARRAEMVWVTIDALDRNRMSVPADPGVEAAGPGIVHVPWRWVAGPARSGGGTVGATKTYVRLPTDERQLRAKTMDCNGSMTPIRFPDQRSFGRLLMLVPVPDL